MRVYGPEELEDAAKGLVIGVMGANSGGARSLAGLVRPAVPEAAAVVSIARDSSPGA